MILALKSLFKTVQGFERQSLVILCVDVLGVNLDGLIVAGDCFLVAAEILEHYRLVIIRIGVERVNLDSLVVAGDCFLVAADNF